jgi:hypothetical protein
MAAHLEPTLVGQPSHHFLVRNFIGYVKLSRVERGGYFGAAVAMVAFTLSVPVSLADFLDPAPWFIYAVVAAVGAGFGVSVVLAGRNIQESPRWLLGTLIGLLLLSYPPVSSFVRESRADRRFLSTAAASKGVVASKFVRGGVHLVVEYEVEGRLYRVTKTGQNPLIGTQAFEQWHRGDSIPVYYQPANPAAVLIDHSDPEGMFLLEALMKRWVLWGLLLTAYLPLIGGRLRRAAGSIRRGAAAPMQPAGEPIASPEAPRA